MPKKPKNATPPPSSAAAIQRQLRRLASSSRATIYQRFFQTSPGQYGHGDIFIGVTVPQLRALARRHRQLPDPSILQLLASPIHEARALALIIWTLQMPSATAARQRQIARLYWRHRQGVNNWDLVDISAYHIVGPALGPGFTAWALRVIRRPRATLWERRIAMVASWHFIRLGQPQPALALAQALLPHHHDLLQKAVGWMLREVGKRCGVSYLTDFLDAHTPQMGRTALRYAIERLPALQRRAYLTR